MISALKVGIHLAKQARGIMADLSLKVSASARDAVSNNPRWVVEPADETGRWIPHYPI